MTLFDTIWHYVTPFSRDTLGLCRGQSDRRRSSREQHQARRSEIRATLRSVRDARQKTEGDRTPRKRQTSGKKRPRRRPENRLQSNSRPIEAHSTHQGKNERTKRTTPITATFPCPAIEPPLRGRRGSERGHRRKKQVSIGNNGG